MTNKVLVVDDDASVREALGQSLDLAGLEPILAGSYIEAKDHVVSTFDGVVVTDIRMPGKDGFDLLEFAHGVDRDLPVILLTGEGDIPMAVRGISAGAFDFLEKPCSPRDLLGVIDKAMRTRALVLENRRLKHQTESGDAASRLLIGNSTLAGQLRNQTRAAARSQAEVLITGEPGTGTAKVAEVIHLLSAVATAPFVKLPAASLSPKNLSKAFDKADSGTLFLDEVAGLDPAVQYGLIERLDSPGGARVIAGTYRDLDQMVTAAAFNHDLLLRLDLMRIRIPALRERTEDIPGLFHHYVSLACEQAALPLPEIPPDVISRLMAQDWPGNARALMNAAMRYAMGLTDTGDGSDLGLTEQLAKVERSLLTDALQRHQGNATAAAQALKLPRKTFYDKLTRYGLRPEDFRG